MSEPVYFRGGATTCEVKAKDSCAGRPNGFYCSELDPASAYQCTNGSLSGGQQCPSGQRCKGPLTTTLTCQ